MPVPVNRQQSSPTTSSLTQFQQELRDWYAEKSRLEYRSPAYAQRMEEQRLRSRIEEEDARMQTLCREERSRLQQRLHKQRVEGLAQVEARVVERQAGVRSGMAERALAVNNAVMAGLLPGGFRRYEPTPEISLEDILYGVSALDLNGNGGGGQEEAGEASFESRPRSSNLVGIFGKIKDY